MDEDKIVKPISKEEWDKIQLTMSPAERIEQQMQELFDAIDQIPSYDRDGDDTPEKENAMTEFMALKTMLSNYFKAQLS